MLVIGGEPTLYPELPRLVRHAVAAGLSVEVFSNLVHVTPAQWAVFALPGVSLATSYYGDTAAGHEAVTRRRGSHARTRANIAEAVRRGIPVRAGIIGAPGSHSVKAAREDLAAAGVSSIGEDRMRGVGRAAADAVTAGELCGQCGHGRATVSPDGEVWPCVIGRFLTAGNVKDRPLADIVGGPRMAEITAMIPPVAPCNPNDSDCKPNAEVCYPAYCNPDKGKPVKGQPRGYTVRWQKHARRLADRAAGPDSGWHEPVSAIPRHRLVPRWWEGDGDRWRWRDGAPDPDAWLAAGYADRSLVTSIAGVHADLAGPETVVSGLPTSSATLPGLVVRMLRHARIGPGASVLDVGTGSGYSAALLARRFGDSAITSVDVDPYLTGAARARLDEIGLRPQIITGDATGPLPSSYDRIVSMMAVRPVPPGWLAALRPGGRLVTTISGTMIIITAVKGSDGTASGQVEWDQAGFMTSRPGPACPPALADMPAAARGGEGEDVHTGRYPVVRVEGSGELQSMLEITAPGIRHCYQESGQACMAWMTHPDGSWARATAPGWRDLPEVHQGGPRRLWDILDDLREYWLTRGYFRLRGARARITPDGIIHLSNGPWKAAISGDPGQQSGSRPATPTS